MTNNDLILITGATGFTGGFVTDLFVSRGKKVRVLIRDKTQMAKFLKQGINVVLGDLNDREAMSLAMEGVTTVIHIAALFRQAGLPASEFHRVNVEGTRNLLDRAIEAGVDKVIHCSTVGVMGHIENPPADEHTAYSPGDPYQTSKMEGEKLFLNYVQEGKIKGTVIRPAMIYGPGDRRTLKIFKPIAEKKFFYVGPGSAYVHFVDVRDLAESFLLAAEAPNINGETFIIAGQTALPLYEMANTIADLMGVPAPWLHLPIKPMQTLGSICEAICTPLHINPPLYRRRVDFFTKDRYFNCSKAHKLLGYKPARSLVEELIDIVNYYVDQGDIKSTSLRRPSAMLRTLDGKICTWCDNNSSIYGWGKEQAVGAISHSLLNTKFPINLETINNKLNEEGTWSGRLIHRNRAGKEVYVESKWKLFKPQEAETPLVLELNKMTNSRNDCSGFNTLGNSLVGTATTFSSEAMSFMYDAQAILL